MNDEHKLGDPIPGAEHHEPPPIGDAAPDFEVKPLPEFDLGDELKPGGSPREPTRPLPRAQRNMLEKQLNDFFAGIALMVAVMGDEVCSTIIAEQAEPLAKAYTELAAKNARVKRILEMMMEGSAWGAVITTTAATVIPIAMHHNLYPKNFPMPFSFGIKAAPPSDEVRDAEKKQQQQKPDKK